MESISLDGSDRRLLLTQVGHAYSVAVVEGVVYWTDWQMESVWRANVSDDGVGLSGRGPHRQLVAGGLDGLMDIHAASLSTRPDTHCESVSLLTALHSHGVSIFWLRP